MISHVILVVFSLQKIIQLCKNRVVLFNNKTKDKAVQAAQVNELFRLVDLVLSSNGGKPFSDKIFAELKVVRTFWSKC